MVLLERMAHRKPVVFFSHSSRDKVALKVLKERFVELTGRTIDVFLSSDGQSIRLGSNWVSSIETALNDATLMFAFVSPQSLNTPWLYFETGHAYGKAKDVVPVGLFGVDIGKLSPPMNLLQGFNLVDAESMNNLIAKVNEAFTMSHKLGFTLDDFSALKLQGGYQVASAILGEHASVVQEVSLSMVVSEDERFALWKLFEDIPNCAKANGMGGASLVMPGATVSLEKQPARQTQVQGSGSVSKIPKDAPVTYEVTVRFDPFVMASVMPVVEATLERLFASGEGRYTVVVRFFPVVETIVEVHRQMARLQEFRFAENYFHGDDWRFLAGRDFGSTNRPPRSYLLVTRPRCVAYSGDGSLAKLIDVIFDRGVFFYDEAGEP